MSNNQHEVLIVVSVFKRGSKESESYCKRVIGVTNEMLVNDSDTVKRFAHGTVDIVINEYVDTYILNKPKQEGTKTATLQTKK
jgi:hypothetical protein